jgi:hypothetical protein
MYLERPFVWFDVERLEMASKFALGPNGFLVLVCGSC